MADKSVVPATQKGPRWSYASMPDRGVTIPCDGGEDCPMYSPYATWSRHYHESVKSEDSAALPSPQLSKHEALGEALQDAARDLPDGWQIQVTIERGAGWAELYNPEGIRADDFDDGDLDLHESIRHGIALAKGETL